MYSEIQRICGKYCYLPPVIVGGIKADKFSTLDKAHMKITAYI